MKKVMISLALVIAMSFSAAAQQGSKWLGGGLTISSTDDGNDNTTSNFSISPRFGYYFNDKWAVGFGLSYSSTTQEDASSNEIKTTGLGLVPFLRYKCVEAGKFNFFGQCELSYTSYNREATTGPVTIKSDYKTTGLDIKPGVAYNINETFAIELTMPSILSYYSNSGDAEGSGMNLGINSGYTIESYLLKPTFSFVYKF